MIANKVTNALSNNLKVILCIGESLEERDSGLTIDVVTIQLNAVKANIPN